MTKKDYIKLAKIIKENLGFESFMSELCIFLKEDNPLFDEEKFRKACGQ